MSDTAKDQAIAQVASICAMVAALDVDYERLQELQKKAADGAWAANWNMPGYMPDNPPAMFETCDEAREYLVDQMQNAADCIDVREFPEQSAEMRALESAAAELRQMIEDTPDAEYGQTIGQYHYFITHMPGTLADEDEAKELQELQEAAGDCEDEDEARQQILDDALSIEIRSDWCNPGEEMTAGEFRIVLCTGGPHVEIVGDLDRGSPGRPRILYRDWGDSGELFDFDRDAVTRYCEQFFFGE